MAIWIASRLLDRGESLAPASRQDEQRLAQIIGRGRSFEPSACPEFRQHAAQIAGVDAEIAPERPVAVGAVAVRELVEHAHLGERQAAREHALIKKAELTGIEAIEGAHAGDEGVGVGCGGVACAALPLPRMVKQLLD